MIRINYGTPWEGDHERLCEFFPEWFYNKIAMGGLTGLIESLSPFSDEPTQSGIMIEDPTLFDGDDTLIKDVENTQTLGEVTSDLPALSLETTQTLRLGKSVA